MLSKVLARARLTSKFDKGALRRPHISSNYKNQPCQAQTVSNVNNRYYSVRHKMQAPKVNKVGPLPTEEAKWTELRKIEVNQLTSSITFRNSSLT